MNASSVTKSEKREAKAISSSDATAATATGAASPAGAAVVDGCNTLRRAMIASAQEAQTTTAPRQSPAHAPMPFHGFAPHFFCRSSSVRRRMDRTALSFSRPASSLDSMEGRQSQYFHSDGPPDDLFYRAEMRFGATPFAYRSKKIKRAVRGQKQLVARRCQVRRARLNSARPLPSKVRPKLPECSHQALNVLGLSGMDDIQIEGRD